ncbi:MAG: HAD family phosphatase [Chitinispirillaceae bacterium]|nr:HAD family phosphatase [Chitinispirillaceae bacterium]
MHIKAIIFDFDGVCIDTEAARFMSWQRIYESYNLQLPRDEWVKNIGKAAYVSDPFVLLEQLAGRRLDREALDALHRNTEVEIADTLPLQPGFEALLHEAHALGISRGIASSSSHRWVDDHLKRRGLFDLLDVIVCREDTGTHKPDPEPYLAALRRLGVAGEHAVAVEDSPAGIVSAQAAGLYCIGVPCSMTYDMDMSAADRLVGSLEEVSLGEMMKGERFITR